ncbi:hypothetical protein HDU92_004433 [Lobulomyces angularis]|nr:hypothetical protein HDU92_004433 [Lobulomyces angularis]
MDLYENIQQEIRNNNLEELKKIFSRKRNFTLARGLKLVPDDKNLGLIINFYLRKVFFLKDLSIHTTWSPLHECCFVDNLDMEIPKFLISKNHEIEVLDSKYSGTPLAWACYCGNLELVKYLVELGANVNAKNSSGQIPMDLVDEEHMQYGEFYEKLTGNSKYTATKKKSDTEKKVEEVSPRKSDRRFKDSDESDGTVEGKWYNFHKIFEFLVDNFDEDNESEEISYPQETDHMVTRSSRREPKNLLNPDNISFISSVGMVSSKNIIRKVIDPSHFKHHSLQIHPSVRTLESY